jgi:hypothetical protein
LVSLLMAGSVAGAALPIPDEVAQFVEVGG